MTSRFRILPLATLLIMALLMTACGPIYQTTYSYVQPRSHRGRMCANRCISQKSMCHNNCNMLNQSCRMQANAIAMPAYHAYLRRMRKAHKEPEKSIRSFADYSGCRSNCSCKTNYDMCFTNCGGQIIPRTVCTLFCDKARPGTV